MKISDSVNIAYRTGTTAIGDITARNEHTATISIDVRSTMIIVPAKLPKRQGDGLWSLSFSSIDVAIST